MDTPTSVAQRIAALKALNARMNECLKSRTNTAEQLAELLDAYSKTRKEALENYPTKRPSAKFQSALAAVEATSKKVFDLKFSAKDAPQIPTVSDAPELPEIAALPEVPEVPKAPIFPEVPEVPKVRVTPVSPATPVSPKTPVVVVNKNPRLTATTAAIDKAFNILLRELDYTLWPLTTIINAPIVHNSCHTLIAELGKHKKIFNQEATKNGANLHALTVAFKKNCQESIDKVKPSLYQYLDFSEQFKNFFKAIANAIIGLFTSNKNSFFSYAESPEEKSILKAETAFKTIAVPA